jgi:predicted MFS family arabinose efflux permease
MLAREFTESLATGGIASESYVTELAFLALLLRRTIDRYGPRQVQLRYSRPDHSAVAFRWSATSLVAGVGAGLVLGGQLLQTCTSAADFGAAALISLLGAVLALGLLDPDRPDTQGISAKDLIA